MHNKMESSVAKNYHFSIIAPVNIHLFLVVLAFVRALISLISSTLTQIGNTLSKFKFSGAIWIEL